LVQEQAKARCNAILKQIHLQRIRTWASREGLVVIGFVQNLRDKLCLARI